MMVDLPEAEAAVSESQVYIRIECLDNPPHIVWRKNMCGHGLSHVIISGSRSELMELLPLVQAEFVRATEDLAATGKEATCVH